ncbi:hypothetical protein [Glutamicibacter sp. TV12E]|uniref:hypothetical protein n=1 Tax=Glutamicibacter sp. TV12E TaxID=3446362 RepID=UPI0040340004
MVNASAGTRAIEPFVDRDWPLAHHDEVVVAEVRWRLDGASGGQGYRRGHIPGAVSCCGSGITACRNLLALEQAGLGIGKFYPAGCSEYAASGGRGSALREAARGQFQE